MACKQSTRKALIKKYSQVCSAHFKGGEDGCSYLQFLTTCIHDDDLLEMLVEPQVDNSTGMDLYGLSNFCIRPIKLPWFKSCIAGFRYKKCKSRKHL